MLKAGLTKRPKILVKRLDNAVAKISVFGNNILFDENFVIHWSRGDFNEKDVDAVLAHEVGHLIDDGNSIADNLHSVFFTRSVGMNVLYLLILPAILFPVKFSLLFTLIALIAVPVWVILLPHVFRANLIKHELIADKNAVDYGLIAPADLLLTAHKRNEIYRNRPVNSKFLVPWIRIMNMLTTTTLAERAENLGVDIEYELKVTLKTPA